MADTAPPDRSHDDAGALSTFGDYVLGAAGLSLLRGWYAPGVPERRRRLIELATAYDTDDVLRFPVRTEEFDAADGYERWAEGYDGSDNPMTAIEQPWMVEHAHAAFGPGAVSLDAGCGTGRLAAALVDIGYEVIGVDVTQAMLDIAVASVPAADFRLGEFEHLPVDDDSIDVITSGLAVCHAADLDLVFAEFARVLQPGGRLIMSNPHPHTAFMGGQAFFAHDGGLPFVRNHPHHVGDYVTAALHHGFAITAMKDVVYDAAATAMNPAAGLWPDVVDGALLDQPFVLIIEAQLGAVA